MKKKPKRIYPFLLKDLSSSKNFKRKKIKTKKLITKKKGAKKITKTTEKKNNGVEKSKSPKISDSRFLSLTLSKKIVP